MYNFQTVRHTSYNAESLSTAKCKMHDDGWEVKKKRCMRVTKIKTLSINQLLNNSSYTFSSLSMLPQGRHRKGFEHPLVNSHLLHFPRP